MPEVARKQKFVRKYYPNNFSQLHPEWSELQASATESLSDSSVGMKAAFLFEVG